MILEEAKELALLHIEDKGNKFAGHGKIWKDWARRIGANPKACSKSNLARPKNHYKYEQTCCGVTYKRHRLRKDTRYYCPKCKKSIFLSK